MTAIDQARDTTLDITEQKRVEAERIGQAIQTNSHGEVARIAHEFVGRSTCCGMEAFTRSLRELERLGHEGELSGAHALLAGVRQKFPRVQSAFTQLVQTLPTSNS
jgi:HPt (histidine-containing phosphotransfer) domain-containing protein